METNTQATAPAATVKTVVDDMPARTTFDSHEKAAAFLIECSTTYSDWNSYPIVAPGLSQDEETGDLVFDPEIYTADMRIAVATVERRIAAGSTSIVAIMLYPAPTIESILDNDAGFAWVQERIDIALNAAAARPLRKAGVNPNDPLVAASMPLTLADYVTKSTGISSTLMQVFEDNWRDVKAVLGASVRPWARANLSKREFMRGMQSAPYAKRVYASLENYADGSAFRFAIECFIALGEAANADVSLYKSWLETRDTFDINDESETTDAQAKPLSLDTLFAALTKKPADQTATQSEAFTSSGDVNTGVEVLDETNTTEQPTE